MVSIAFKDKVYLNVVIETKFIGRCIFALKTWSHTHIKLFFENEIPELY